MTSVLVLGGTRSGKSRYAQRLSLDLTDRPVYRPDQTVHYKFWVRYARYDMVDTSAFAGQSFTVEVRNPKNDKILTKTLKADNYGGFEGELELPADATLGVYRMHVKLAGRRLGGGSFRGFLARFDTSGNNQWASTWDSGSISDSGHFVAVDSGERVYAVGNLNNKARVARYSASGDELWVARCGSQESDASVDILGNDPNRLGHPSIIRIVNSQPDLFDLGVIDIVRF